MLAVEIKRLYLAGLSVVGSSLGHFWGKFQFFELRPVALAVEPVGVGGEQHLNRMPQLLGDEGRGHASH
ncbi:hypothetical protein D3C80_2166760 [compost metagenome]